MGSWLKKSKILKLRQIWVNIPIKDPTKASVGWCLLSIIRETDTNPAAKIASNEIIEALK